MMTDLLAKFAIGSEYTALDQPEFQFERSPIIPVRHPPEMLFRYLFQPEILRVYASFPIGSPRRVSDPAEKQKVINEIDDFRNSLHRSYCVFDPVTIDELPLREMLTDAGDNPKTVLELSGNDQWQIPADRTLCGEERENYNLKTDEVVEVARPMGPSAKSELARQVEGRDYRLIHQSDCVVIYRPTYNRKIWDDEPAQWSMGTYHEALHARNIGRPIIVIRDPVCDEELTMENIGIELTPEEVFEEEPDLNNSGQRQKVFEWLNGELERRSDALVSKRRLNRDTVG